MERIWTIFTLLYDYTYKDILLIITRKMLETECICGINVEMKQIMKLKTLETFNYFLRDTFIICYYCKCIPIIIRTGICTEMYKHTQAGAMHQWEIVECPHKCVCGHELILRHITRNSLYNTYKDLNDGILPNSAMSMKMRLYEYISEEYLCRYCIDSLINPCI